jgi:hypothetical protein
MARKRDWLLTRGLTRGLALRAIQTVEPLDHPEWMARFLDSLRRADLAAATVRGYRYDLRHFLRCRLGTGRGLATVAAAMTVRPSDRAG